MRKRPVSIVPGFWKWKITIYSYKKNNQNIERVAGIRCNDIFAKGGEMLIIYNDEWPLL